MPLGTFTSAAQRNQPGLGAGQQEQQQHVQPSTTKGQPEDVVPGLAELPGAWFTSLVQQLPPESLLQLFKASQLLSASILQQHNSITLTLDARREQGSSKQQLQARRSAVLSILSAAHDSCTLRVVLTNGISTVWYSLPRERVTHLTLQHFKLTARSLSQQLHLQSCTHLHTLSLGSGCSSHMPAADVKALQQQRSMWLPPSLANLAVDWSAAQYVGPMLQLLAPQLAGLVVPICALNAPYDVLLPLTSLRRFESGGNLCDVLFSLPQLTHVTIGRIKLHTDHSQDVCIWQQLNVTKEAETSQLQRLPLQHIPYVTIYASMICDAPMDVTYRVASQLSSVPTLQCVPCTSHKLQQPYFTLSGQYSAELVKQCANRLPPNSAVVLQECTLDMCDMVDVFSHLHTNVTCVCFSNYEVPCFSSAILQSPDQQACWKQLVAALPQHITGIVLFAIMHVNECTATARGLVQALADSSQHKHVMVSVAAREVSGRAGEPDAPAELHQLVKDHPQHVQLHVFPCNPYVRVQAAACAPKS